MDTWPGPTHTGGGLDGQQALAVFSGPHAYVSPTWYETENVVPTWNYAAVHATGSVELIADRQSLLEIVTRTVAVYEAPMPRPWTLDRNSPVVDRLLAQIVGFRLPIERLVGKWKLNQNHPAARREKVVAALEYRGDADGRAVAELMRQSPSAGG